MGKPRQSLAQAARHLFELRARNRGRGQKLAGEPMRQIEPDGPDDIAGFVDIDRRLRIESDAPRHDQVQ